MSGTNRLFSAFQSLDSLVDARNRHPSTVPAEICALAADRALDSVASTLASMLPPTTPTAATSRILQTLAALLARLLLAVAPLLSGPRKKNENQGPSVLLDALFGRLVTTILVPLVSNFYQLSLGHLSAVFPCGPAAKSSSRAKKLSFDIRPDALNLLCFVLATLRDLASSSSRKPVLIPGVRSVHETVTLSAVRELAKLYPPLEPAAAEGDEASAPSPPNAVGETHRRGPALPQVPTPPLPSQAHAATDSEGTATQTETQKTAVRAHPPRQQPPRSTRTEQQAPPQPADRVAKLARKDTLWYLCNVLHCAIPDAALGASIPGAQPQPPPPSMLVSSSGTSCDTAAANQMLQEGVCTVLAGMLRGTKPPAAFHAGPGRRARDDPSSDILTNSGEDEQGRNTMMGSKAAVQQVRRRGQLGNVEREMVLAVAEKLWLSQGC